MKWLKLKGSSAFKVEWISSSHISVNFCLIFKNYVSKSKLSFFYQTKHIPFIYLVLKLCNAYAMLCTFFGTPSIKIFFPLNGELVSSYEHKGILP